MSSRREPVELCSLLQDVGITYRPLAEEKGIQPIINHPATSVTIKSDRAKVRAILDNLCSNAIEHCTSSHVEMLLEDTIPLKLSVRDDGPGLARGVRDAFRKRVLSVLSPRPGKDSQGIVIGLAIVQEYATQLRWDCQLETSEGNGACFTFSVPQGRRSGATRPGTTKHTRKEGR